MQALPERQASGALAQAGVSPLEGRGECRRCAALCCMALAFDTSQGFGLDKPNAVACPHLTPTDRCAIHAARAAEGFPGCVGFDCSGVGQYVSETVFAGRHWRGDPVLMAEMTAAFSIMRDIAALSDMLEAAAAWPLTPDDEARRQSGLCRLWPAMPWNPAMLSAFEASGAIAEIHSFLRSLRRYVRRGAPA